MLMTVTQNCTWVQRRWQSLGEGRGDSAQEGFLGDGRLSGLGTCIVVPHPQYLNGSEQVLPTSGRTLGSSVLIYMVKDSRSIQR